MATLIAHCCRLRYSNFIDFGREPRNSETCRYRCIPEQITQKSKTLDSNYKIFNKDGIDVSPKPLICDADKKTKPKKPLSFIINKLQDQKKDSQPAGAGAKRWRRLKKPTSFKKVVKIVTLLNTISEPQKPKDENVNRMTLILTESPTIWLLNLTSFGALAESEEAQMILNDQARLNKRKCGKEKGKHSVDSSMQTNRLNEKQKATQTKQVLEEDKLIFATEWDLYDTYRKLTADTEIDSKRSLTTRSVEVYYQEDLQKEKEFFITGKTKFDAGSCSQEIKEEDENIKLLLLPEFKRAVAIMQRLLASNNFHRQQAAFMGLQKQTKNQTEIRYTMNLMWTFSCAETEGRTVTALSWNRVNNNIVAVGYGKYFYSDEIDGLVCCWSVKNPCQPERIFHLPHPVTSLSFSSSRPNLLAVGCYSGAVNVINVASQTLDYIVLNEKLNVPMYGPLWKVVWFNREESATNTEEILSVDQSGQVRKWNTEADYGCFELLKLKYYYHDDSGDPGGTVEKIRMRHLAGLSLSLHPTNPMQYYVATEEGYIAMCSINNRDQYMRIYKGHIGPVYGIYHSKFCPNVYITHGADWNICFWAENITEPLFKLCCTMEAVNDVAWSPTHSTILASVSGDSIFIWDISRKIVQPLTTTKAPTGSLSTIIFSTSGKNLLVGDMKGNVYVYSLTEMPQPPYLQKEAFMRSLENALISKPAMLKKLLDTVPK